jgi:hypothetical protein
MIHNKPTPDAQGVGVLILIIEGEKFEWHKQYITGAEIKNLAGIDPAKEIYLSLKEPWDDELISDEQRVDLARPGIEEFRVKQKLKFILRDKEYEWYKQFITGAQLRKLGDVSEREEIYLAIARPWDDEVIQDDTLVDLARPGIERFIVRKNGGAIQVEIKINDKPYEVKRGRYTVSELKKIGNVPPADELEELIDGKLVPLDDQATVLIKGCEQFFSHKRDGSSS